VVSDPSGGWKTEPVDTKSQLLSGLMSYRFSHGMYYANAEILARQVVSLAKEAKPRLNWLCIDSAAIDDVDYTAAAALCSLYGLLQKQGIRLVFSEVSPDVHAQLEGSGIVEKVGKDGFYATTGEMVAAYRRAFDR
jgi:MFS superfamily sulfate permease-like transporter